MKLYSRLFEDPSEKLSHWFLLPQIKTHLGEPNSFALSNFSHFISFLCSIKPPSLVGETGIGFRLTIFCTHALGNLSSTMHFSPQWDCLQTRGFLLRSDRLLLNWRKRDTGLYGSPEHCTAVATSPYTNTLSCTNTLFHCACNRVIHDNDAQSTF